MDPENRDDEANKIREKRLARLQRKQNREPSQDNNNHQTPVMPSSQNRPPSGVHDVGANQTVLASEGVDGEQPSSNLMRTSKDDAPPRPPNVKRPLEEPAPARRMRSGGDLTALERWEDRTLSDIFGVTVHDDAAPGNFYLETVKRDLEEQGQRNRMCLAVVDQAVLAVASSSAHGSPFSYALRCYRRASSLARNARISAAEDQYKADVFKEAKRLCVSYCEFALTCPEMFEGNNLQTDLANELLKDSDDQDYIPPDLLQELSLRFGEDETLELAFLEALESLSRRLGELEFLDEYKPFVNSFGRLVGVKILAALMTQSSRFIPKDMSIQNLEKGSMLGPLFRLSPLQATVAKTYFPAPRTQSPSSIDSAVNSLRIMSRNHQEHLFLIVNAIVRSSEPARNRMLDFFSHVINLNHKRRALQVDDNTVSSDGFLLNINAVLHKLCEPFMDATYSKIDKIDAKYFRYSPRVDITGETKMNADQKTSDEFYEMKLEGRPNFNSEVFYLNLAAYHVGYIAAVQNSESLSHTLSDMERHMERLRREREKHLNSPHLALLDRNISLLETRIQNGLSYKTVLDGIVSHDTIQLEGLSFLNYLAVWILNLISPNRVYPSQQFRLPLPETPPLEFTYFPEYYVEDVAIVFTETISLQEVEHHTNFYQKFNIRYHMAQIIKSIWRNPTYRDKLRQESKHNPEFFVRFVALLLNDVTYLLDESLTKLTEIHRLQDKTSGEEPEPQTVGEPERDEQLASAENQASIYVGLANETVLMVRHFTAAIPGAFVTKELVHRLAGMLNYNLDALVGPKCSSLKVENPQKYRFDPRGLLSEIVSIYLNLKDNQSFVEAIAKDGRSYKPELFIRAGGILSKYALKPSEDLRDLEQLAKLVERAKTADDEDEEELGDIPEEFLDPLLATIMEEPVILPSSRATVDLSTIKAHLLSDSKDPFNRAPLRIEDVIPDMELKRKINHFIAEKKRAKGDANMQTDP